ncbi:hypothetical protein KC340_g67 [Hortaea werneckii]|nr:hypothetical protein KC340_g67 [Hortaea werneckii]
MPTTGDDPALAPNPPLKPSKKLRDLSRFLGAASNGQIALAAASVMEMWIHLPRCKGSPCWISRPGRLRGKSMNSSAGRVN